MAKAARPSVLLGLCAFTHDSAAALLVDGRLVGVVEEERLSGVKHTKAYPTQAVRWLLEDAGLEPEDVGLVAYNFAGHRYLAAIPRSLPYLLRQETRARVLPRVASFAVVHARYRRRMRVLHAAFPAARIARVAHHRAHGLYAVAASGYADAAVLVVDSLGETQTTTIGHARTTRPRGTSYRIVATVADPHSLGYAYGAVTVHLGWRRSDEEGTVMALAALGDPRRFRWLFAQAIRLTPAGFKLDPRWFALRVLRHGWARVTPRFVAATCPPRQPGEEVTQVHADLAAALQERTEQAMLHLARRAHQLTGARRLCVGGGVATNCVGVGKLVSAGLFEEVFVPPAPGDAGTAVGAAVAAHLAGTGGLPDGIQGCYLGPAYPDYTPPVQPRPGLAACRIQQPASVLAEQLAAGQIVGVCAGRVELGPRALGNRSILASPLLPGVVERLNATVKYREPFRPFAPVVLADHASGYFLLPQPSPYMSIAVAATDLARAQIPTIVHANGTARVQTVTHQQHPFLAQVLEALHQRTGVPVLINTSLNVKGKPICGTPDMALDCLAESGLDGLLLDGGWWVTKR